MCREDHTAGEAVKKQSKKGKNKSTGEEIGDGRALLSRLLACGRSFGRRSFLTQLKTLGILRNIIKPASRSDEDVDIQRLTNEVIMPLVNGLLDVDLANVSNRVSQLAAEAVSLFT